MALLLAALPARGAAGPVVQAIMPEHEEKDKEKEQEDGLALLQVGRGGMARLRDGHGHAAGAKADEAEATRCTRAQPLVFLHIPKNAGTAIEDSAHNAGISWGRYMDFEGCSLGADICVAKWHTPPGLLQGINIYTSSKVFCVVRNPYARAVSEYQYFASHPEFQDQYGGAPVPGKLCSAEGLNSFLGFVLKEYLRGQVHLGMCHILPQSHYIWAPPNGTTGAQEQTCTEVLRLEEFPRAFNDLMKRYGYNNVKLPEHHVNKAACGALTANDLSTNVKSLMRQVYAEDFRQLGYSE